MRQIVSNSCDGGDQYLFLKHASWNQIWYKYWFTLKKGLVIEKLEQTVLVSEHPACIQIWHI